MKLYVFIFSEWEKRLCVSDVKERYRSWLTWRESACTYIRVNAGSRTYLCVRFRLCSRMCPRRPPVFPLCVVLMKVIRHPVPARGPAAWLKMLMSPAGSLMRDPGTQSQPRLPRACVILYSGADAESRPAESPDSHNQSCQGRVTQVFWPPPRHTLL